jgi:hypothetical protein
MGGKRAQAVWKQVKIRALVRLSPRGRANREISPIVRELRKSFHV